MKSLIKLILAVIAIIFCGSATEAAAQTLSARVKNTPKGVTYRQPYPKYMVSDSGKPLVRWNQQVTYRAINDTFVYRSEGKATGRQDEMSSPVFMFHVSDGEVRPGHAYQERGN